ncbi:MAG: hypothetical protein ACR2OW_09865 [Methyloligellaceae bacterium]
MPLKNFGEALRQLWPTLTIRFRKKPITTAEELVEFIQTRAAYVAQTSLYGYLKTRMGTKFVKVFQDDEFAPSLAHAKWRVYGICLSDLTVFCVATTFKDIQTKKTDCEDFARLCFEQATLQGFDDPDYHSVRDQSRAEFEDRLPHVNWQEAPEGEKAFTESPEGVVEFAPIIKEFKELDKEIVINSTRFRWRDVRDQLRRRIDGLSVHQDWIEREPSDPSGI